MSFVITVYVPTGVVMASDSRQSITIEGKSPDGKPMPKIETVSSDFAYKTFLLPTQSVGINTFGESLLGKTSIESHIKRFAEEILDDNDDINSIPQKLIDFFRRDFPQADTAFHVAGYNRIERKSIPYVFLCHVGKNSIQRQNLAPNTDTIVYGATWGGQADVIASLLQPTQTQPKPPIIWDAMTVQDAIDFAIYAVRTTIDTMRFQARPKNVGGPVDVLLIRPDEPPRWIQRKEFRGEIAWPV
jgi:hypothetical protein